MNIIKLIRDGVFIELLVSSELDLSLITANATQLFELKSVTEQALKDFLSDHTADFDNHQAMIDELKDAGVIGYPITPMKDARMYACDKKICIKSELELNL